MEKKNFFEAISAGISDGFKEIGLELNDRDKKIVYFTTVAAITIAERFKEIEIDNQEEGGGR